MRKIIVICSMAAAALCACQGNEATRVGNPAEDLSPPPKAFVEQYLAAHPYAKGSQAGAQFEEMFWLWFDVEQGVVTRRATGVLDVVSSFSITEEGGIATDGALSLTISYNPALQVYPIEATVGGERALFSSISDPASVDNPAEPVQMCLSGGGCYNPQADTAGGAYYLSGFVQGGTACGMTAHDFCAVKGEVLAEAFCHAGKIAWKYVRGDCRSGKLRDSLSDTPPPSEITWDDLCALYPVCSHSLATQVTKFAEESGQAVIDEWMDHQAEWADHTGVGPGNLLP